MSICEDLFQEIFCPRDFDDRRQTACCPDGQGCCFPTALAGDDALAYLSESSASNEYWNNVFMLATLLILAFAVFFLCCDTSSSTSSSHSREDEVLQMVHHDSAKPFEFETVPAEDEYGRPLRILRHDGMMATAPPLDHQNTPVHSYATFDRERRSPYAQPSLIIASTRGDQSETVPPPPPPPYRENSAFADMSFLQLPAAVDGLTSAQSRSIVRNTHPGSSGSSMVFVPR